MFIYFGDPFGFWEDGGRLTIVLKDRNLSTNWDTLENEPPPDYARNLLGSSGRFWNYHFETEIWWENHYLTIHGRKWEITHNSA